MDEHARANDIILLFDDYSQGSRDLHDSFRKAGYRCPAVVIEDDGFLPEDVMSVYGFFLGDFRKELGESARPKYFNEIVAPDYWEISGNNSNGMVQDLSRVRGKIFYAEPAHKRLVKIVDWYDEKGTVRASDHYNRYGAIYGRTIFNAKGQKVNKSYFSASGQEVIVENYVTGDIILNDGGQVLFFRSKTDFILHFFIQADFKQSRIFFNSLSTPFFVSNKLSAQAKRDVLFWQEPVGDEIPGNMQIILKGNASRTERIFVQKKRSYDKLLSLGASADMVQKLGFAYSFQRENGHKPEALICTNSDRVEHCHELANALPEMHFHIAALTEMSSKLMAVGNYENVSLYPGVKIGALEDLFGRCDYYLDINHEGEIVSAVRKAFLHNQLIMAFQETAHNYDYVADKHVYAAKDYEAMIADLREIMADGALLERHLEEQREAAMAEEASAYTAF